MAQYDSYLVRVWRSAGPHHAQWSGRLEHLQGGDVLRFSTPQALLSHLQRFIGECPPERSQLHAEAQAPRGTGG